MNTLLLQTKRDKIKDKEREPTLNSKIDSTNVDFSFQQRYIHFKTEPPTAEVKDLLILPRCGETPCEMLVTYILHRLG